VKIAPHNLQTGRKYLFRAKWDVVFPGTYSTIISFARPTINATVEVDCPAEFSFSVDPIPDASYRNRWVYNRLFLPSQHLRYRWEPTSPPGNTDAPHTIGKQFDH
jgi:hypothetical protein